MPLIAPNDAPVHVSVRIYDQWQRPLPLDPNARVTWGLGDNTLASLVVSADTQSADIIPLAGRTGDYNYSWTCGDVTHADVVTFTTPLASSGDSHHEISAMQIGAQ